MVAPTVAASQQLSTYVPTEISNDMLTAALQYADSLKAVVVPIDPSTKSPGSILGKGWPAKASSDPQQIRRWWTDNPSAGIGIVTGPSNLVVFDLDVESVPEELYWLKAGLIQHSRDNERGHYIFSSSETFTAGDLRLIDGTKVGDIRSGNTIFVASPTPHSKGGEYRWVTTGEVPELPDIGLPYLSTGAGCVATANVAEIESFAKEHTTQNAPSYLEPVLRDYQQELSESLDNTHTPTFAVLCRIARESRAGAYSFRPAVKQVRAIAERHYSSRDRPFDRADFRRIVGDSVARANAENLDHLKKRVFRDYGTDSRTSMSHNGSPVSEPFDDDDDPFSEPDVDPLANLDALKPTGYEIANEVRRQLLRREAKRVAKSIEAKELADLCEDRTFDGLAFLERRAVGEPIWGQGKSALWPKNQGFMVFGDDGAGKSTLIQQVVLAAKGLRSPKVLDHPVAALDGVVVYIAADRPANIQDSFGRMVDTTDRATARRFAESFRFWSGAVPFLADDDPQAFAQWCIDRANGEPVGMVVLDSVKDVLSDPASNLAGAQFNRMVQELIERGIEFGCCHHNRKSTGDNKKPKLLSDVFGSRFLTAGLGSVLNIWIPIADRTDRELSQLKAPYGAPVSRIDYANDSDTGTQKTNLDLGGQVTALLYKAAADGLTDNELVFRLYGLNSDDDGHGAARSKITRWIKTTIDRDLAKSGMSAFERASSHRDGNRCKVWRLKIDGIDYAQIDSGNVVNLDAKAKERRLLAELAEIDQKMSALDDEAQ